MKQSRKAFTLVELLVVIGIIALLVSIVVPALNTARMTAKKAALRSIFHTLETGLEQFKTDQGAYPESTYNYSLYLHSQTDTPSVSNYNNSYVDMGAHHLAEAMFGLDRLGYQQNHWYQISDGSVGIVGTPIDGTSGALLTTKRWGPYVNAENLNVGTMADVPLPNGPTVPPDPSTWKIPPNYNNLVNPNPVILDNLNPLNSRPILYYRAFSSGNLIPQIYNYTDNSLITDVFGMLWSSNQNKLDASKMNLKCFNYYVWDRKTGFGADDLNKIKSPSARSFNRDSYILISAGPDGNFGTEDDITNFERNR